MAAVSQTPASVLAGTGIARRQVVAGGTITAGMPVYKDTADSDKYKAARANAVGTAIDGGIALNNAANGQPLSIQETEGDINVGGTLIVGETYCIGATAAGTIEPKADIGVGEFMVVLGVASTATNLKYRSRTAGVAQAS